jgi:hypothetical protein
LRYAPAWAIFVSSLREDGDYSFDSEKEGTGLGDK